MWRDQWEGRRDLMMSAQRRPVVLSVSTRARARRRSSARTATHGMSDVRAPSSIMLARTREKGKVGKVPVLLTSVWDLEVFSAVRLPLVSSVRRRRARERSTRDCPALGTGTSWRSGAPSHAWRLWPASLRKFSRYQRCTPHVSPTSARTVSASLTALGAVCYRMPKSTGPVHNRATHGSGDVCLNVDGGGLPCPRRRREMVETM